jgi:hypothetical protein
MNNESAQVFLNKVKEKINKGDYDSEITVPFMSKATVFNSIKARVDRKLETGGTPLLNDAEIKDAIKDAKELAATSFFIFQKLGIMEKNDAGEWHVSAKGEKLLKAIKTY